MRKLFACIFLALLYQCSNNNERNLRDEESVSADSSTVSVSQTEISIESSSEKNQFSEFSVLAENNNLQLTSFDEAIKSLPVFGDESYFKFDHEKKNIWTNRNMEVQIKPIKVPDQFFHNSNDTIVTFGSNYQSKYVPSVIIKRLDSLISVGKRNRTSTFFYFLIDLNNNFYNIFVTKNERVGEKTTHIERKIYAFDKKGLMKSEMDFCDEFYILNSSIISIWWFASDDDCTYQKWIQDKNGYFHNVYEGYQKPDELKDFKTQYHGC